MFSWCTVEVTEVAVASTALVPNVELPLKTVKALLEGPFFELGSILWETSLFFIWIFLPFYKLCGLKNNVIPFE